MSMVPGNVSNIVQSDVSQAQANGGNFRSTQIPPVPGSVTLDATYLSHRHFPSRPNECGKQYLTGTSQRHHSYEHGYALFLHEIGIKCATVVRAFDGARDPFFHVL